MNHIFFLQMVPGTVQPIEGTLFYSSSGAAGLCLGLITTFAGFKHEPSEFPSEHGATTVFFPPFPSLSFVYTQSPVVYRFIKKAMEVHNRRTLFSKNSELAKGLENSLLSMELYTLTSISTMLLEAPVQIGLLRGLLMRIPFKVCQLKGCEVKVSLAKCARCEAVKQCCREHQKEDFPSHKVYCRRKSW